ncbi:MAG: hypothetical protein WBO43_00410 [Gemmatimonadota bacterium]|jgi:hypothetical protein
MTECMVFVMAFKPGAGTQRWSTTLLTDALLIVPLACTPRGAETFPSNLPTMSYGPRMPRPTPLHDGMRR